MIESPKRFVLFAPGWKMGVVAAVAGVALVACVVAAILHGRIGDRLFLAALAFAPLFVILVIWSIRHLVSPKATLVIDAEGIIASNGRLRWDRLAETKVTDAGLDLQPAGLVIPRGAVSVSVEELKTRLDALRPAELPAAAKSAGDAMIEATELTKQFGSAAAVDGISFSIPRGQIVAFLGPNGAGKTTTMRMLTGFLTPTHGTARIAGFDVATQRLDAARHVGYLPENGPLYGDMSPRELLTYFGRARGLGSRIGERIEAVTQLCRLESVLQKPIHKLSKGFRQRVGMAQALLHEPDVLILDEPTSGLDPNQIRDMRSAIRDIGRNRTILLSTHILQEVSAVAGRVLLIHAGRIVYDGAPDQVNDAFFHAKTENGR